MDLDTPNPPSMASNVNHAQSNANPNPNPPSNPPLDTNESENGNANPNANPFAFIPFLGLPFLPFGLGAPFGAGGIPLSMLSAERPPDPKRAHTLLKGLSVVPHGLVRRLERVEAYKDKMTRLEQKARAEREGTPIPEEKQEGNTIGEGKLLCPVCYEPLLPDQEEAKDDTKEEEEEKMEEIDESALSELPTPIAESPNPIPSASPINDSTKASPPPTTEAPKRKRRTYPYQQPGALIALPCTHIFHATSCLRPWFETGKTTCPTCRFDIDPQSETLDLATLGGRSNRRRGQNNYDNVANNGPTIGNAEPAPNPSSANTPPHPPAPNSAPENAEASTTNITPGTTTGNDFNPPTANNSNVSPNPTPPPNPFRQFLNQALRLAVQQAMASALRGSVTNQPPPPSNDNSDARPTGPQAPTTQTPQYSDTIDGRPVFGPQLPPGFHSPSHFSNPPSNPSPTGDANAPEGELDSFLVRDIYLSNAPGGGVDVWMRETVVPGGTIGRNAASNGGNGSASGGGVNEGNTVSNSNTNSEASGTGREGDSMEGVEPTNQPSTSNDDTNTLSTNPSANGTNNGLSPSSLSTRTFSSSTSVPRRPFMVDVIFVLNGANDDGRPSDSTTTLGASGINGTQPATFASGSNQSTASNTASSPAAHLLPFLSFGPFGTTNANPSFTATGRRTPSTGSPLAPTSRPSTPVGRHHPYANRPTNPNPTPAHRGIGSDAPNVPSSPPGQRDDGPTTQENVPANQSGQETPGFARRSITFSFSFGPEGTTMSTSGPGTQPPFPNPPGGMPFPEGFLVGGNIIFGQGGPEPSPRPRTNRPRKKWTPPEGTSLRSVVELKEREVGLRCDDVSCLWAPEDNDDFSQEIVIRDERVWLKKLGGDGLLEPSCKHRFHPECLLVSSRVAEGGLEEEIERPGEDRELLEVGCPLCRVRGGLTREEWKRCKVLSDSV